MSPLTDLPIPPAPVSFTPDGAPPGVAVDLAAYDSSWVAKRPTIVPRLVIVHTNGAAGEGSLQSAINWSNGGDNRTHAHYNINAPKPTKHLRTDLRAIANSTRTALEQSSGESDVSFWSIAIETADRGYLNGGSIDLGDFLYDHAELVARIIAYESIVWNIPIEIPGVWNGAGVVTHTEPFPYPHYTTVNGKTCPGTTKKHRVLRGDILPRARQLATDWTNPNPNLTPSAKENDDMQAVDDIDIRFDHTITPNHSIDLHHPAFADAVRVRLAVHAIDGSGQAWLTYRHATGWKGDHTTPMLINGPGTTTTIEVPVIDGVARIGLKGAGPYRLLFDLVGVKR